MQHVQSKSPDPRESLVRKACVLPEPLAISSVIEEFDDGVARLWTAAT
jgi:hypothetical protein